MRFSTYGVPMISGEIRRYLRDNSPIPRQPLHADTAYQVLQEGRPDRRSTAAGRHSMRSQRELVMPRRDVVFALDAISDPISLFEPIYTDSGESICVMDQVGDTKNTDEQWLERLALSSAISDLNGRARKRSSPCAFTPVRRRWRSPVRSASVRLRYPGWRKTRSARSARTSSLHKAAVPRSRNWYQNAAEGLP